MMRLLPPVLALLVLSASASAQAAPPPGAPSPHEATAPGRIVGRLTGEGQAPLPGHTVTLEILQGRTLILAIPKQTDERGRYEFKNIFRSPEFSYAVSAEHEGKTYRTPFVSLQARDQELTLDLATGNGAPEPGPKSGDGLGQYKLLALILSLVAAGLALAGRRK